MTKEEISSYIKVGTFSTEVLESIPEDGSLRWYYRDDNGKLYTRTSSSRFAALKEAESLGFNSWE